MIAIDWGTSSFRAWRVAADGAVADGRSAPRGILSVPEGGFAAALRELVGDWLDAGERRILLSGMVGSRQGWLEAPYLGCPADPAALAGAVVPAPLPGVDARIVPGLVGADPSGVPEVMRGEETQIVGLLPVLGPDGIVCLPGSHSKWVTVAGGAVAGFTTHMTGESFAALRGHTILGRLMTGEGHNGPAFAAGLARSGDPGGLLHHLFGARTLVLTDRMGAEAAPSYLSGLLLGHEIRAATLAVPADAPVFVVGSAALAARYGEALGVLGRRAVVPEGEWALAGLRRIAEEIRWS